MSCKYLYVAHRMAISRMRLSIHKFPVEVLVATQKLQEKKEYVICVRTKALENNFIIAYIANIKTWKTYEIIFYLVYTKFF